MPAPCSLVLTLCPEENWGEAAEDMFPWPPLGGGSSHLLAVSPAPAGPPLLPRAPSDGHSSIPSARPHPLQGFFFVMPNLWPRWLLQLGALRQDNCPPGRSRQGQQGSGDDGGRQARPWLHMGSPGLLEQAHMHTGLFTVLEIKMRASHNI